MAHISWLPYLMVRCLPCTAFLFVLASVCALPLRAQVPLTLVDDQTTVSRISFRFVDGQTLPEETLKQRIWHNEPGFLDRLRRVVPFVEARPYAFRPIELQRDVARLRNYYQRNGYLHPSIDYPASQLDTVRNRIHVIFTIREGPPLIIQDVGFFDPEGRFAADTLAGTLRQRWLDFRDGVTLEAGARYTEFHGLRIQDDVLTWFKNSGFAFVDVLREVDVDTAANTVDLRFIIDPGPRGAFAEIQFEGHETIDDEVLRRHLPFRVGDQFSSARLAQGQRDLFALNLFRVVVAEVPEQPEDSSVVVRYRLREARPRNISAQTGYALDQGATVEGDWTHRNFMGAARQLNISGMYTTGYGAATAGGLTAVRRVSANASLRQPYFFSRRLSASAAPFYLWEDSPLADARLREAGIRSTLVYTIYHFRTVSFQHTYARALPIGDTSPLLLRGLEIGERERVGVFNRNVFRISATLGRVDEYLSPSSGFLLRPLLESGGQLVQLPDDVNYFKASTEAVGYLPLGGDFNLSGRLFVGRVWPTGESRDQTDLQTRFRFQRIRFYAGGAADVRGWPSDLLGPKGIVADTLFTPGGAVERVRFLYRPNGGLGKMSANVELRTPLPLTGPAWLAAVFLDMGQVFPSSDDFSDVAESDARGAASFNLRDVQFGTGVGLRYMTVVGFVRIDVGYKVNPRIDDVASPEDVLRFRRGEITREEVETPLRNRFRIHLSIGHAF